LIHERSRDIAKAAKGARTVYFFAGLAGHILRYRPLARLLNAKWRMHGVHYPVFAGGESDVDDIATLANQMAPALEAAEEPIVLAGYSIGGLVAYEIARKLRASGRQVAVVMIDTTTRRMLANLRRQRPMWQHIVLRLQLAFARIFVRWPTAALRRFRLAAPVKPSVLPDAAPAREFFYACQRAARTYLPPESDVPVIVIRAVSPLQPSWLPRVFWRGPDRGWGLVAEVLDVIPCPGDHLTIADPKNATALAKSLDQAFDIAFASLKGAPIGSAPPPPSGG